MITNFKEFNAVPFGTGLTRDLPPDQAKGLANLKRVAGTMKLRSAEEAIKCVFDEMMVRSTPFFALDAHLKDRLTKADIALAGIGSSSTNPYMPVNDFNTETEEADASNGKNPGDNPHKFEN